MCVSPRDTSIAPPDTCISPKCVGISPADARTGPPDGGPVLLRCEQPTDPSVASDPCYAAIDCVVVGDVTVLVPGTAASVTASVARVTVGLTVMRFT